jgi:hypothetical protein
MPPLMIPTRERLEYCVYRTLLNMVPGLEEHLVNSSDEETQMIADLVGNTFLIGSAVLIKNHF